MAVHNVDVNIICARAGDRANFITQGREVGGEDGRGNSNRFLHGD
jgi:hypothetical protein